MHKNKRRLGPRSMKGRMMLWMAVFLLPILVIMVICSTVTMRSYERQMQEYVQQMVAPFSAEMDTVLNSAVRYVAGKTIDFELFEEPEGQEKLRMLERMESLGDEISGELSVQEGIDAVFWWNGEKIWFVQNYNQSYTKNRTASLRLREVLKEQEDQKSFYQGYQFFEVDDAYYLFLALDVKGGKIGCWFSEYSLMENLKNAKLDGLEKVVFQDSEGNLLDAKLSENPREMEQYFVSNQELGSNPFSIVALWDRKVIFKPVYSLVKIVMWFLIAAYGLFVAYLFSVQRSVMRPLGRLVKVIGQVKKGEISEIEVDTKEPTEMQGVFYAMNDMIQEVKNLKIRVYEEQIAEQETKLQLYQLQLRPHFFLNILNSIVSFARSKDYQMVQKMTMFLAGHCRYILYHTWYVSLEDELAYTQNYVNMRSIQSGKESFYSEDVEETVLGAKIPILCVQIFVENAMKYAANAEEQIKIYVHAGKIQREQEDKLYIMIDDTGKGFSEEQIRKLQEDDGSTHGTEGDHGIGIVNVKQRLKILYGDCAKISFSNNEKGGAHIEMEVPFWEKIEGGARER